MTLAVKFNVNIKSKIHMSKIDGNSSDLRECETDLWHGCKLSVFCFQTEWNEINSGPESGNLPVQMRISFPGVCMFSIYISFSI